MTAAANNDYHEYLGGEIVRVFDHQEPQFPSPRIALTEAATNVASWICGLTDTTTTGGLQTGTQRPLASFQGDLLQDQRYATDQVHAIHRLYSVGQQHDLDLHQRYDLQPSVPRSPKGDGTTGRIIPTSTTPPGP